MTPLRQRMIEDMQLRGLSDRTQEAYSRTVRQLAEHYSRSPDQICEEELRQYFLYRAIFDNAYTALSQFACDCLYRQRWFCATVIRRM